MPGRFTSIFSRTNRASSIAPPSRERPLMRVLEPRILLDAAAVETALDIAGQAVHSQLADDYLANSRASNELAPAELMSSDIANTDDEDAEMAALAERSVERELVFIDATVPNIDDLIASLEEDAQVIILLAGEDGVQQIVDAMDSGKTYDAIHIFSHGSTGQLQLGDSVLNAASITGQYAANLTTIGEHLSADADILIYGCDFGQGVGGEQAIRLLAQTTGADIAASDDLTGSESLSGDWDLEVSTGDVEATSYTLPQWQGILAGFELRAVTDPLITHSEGGIAGTPGTIAIWSNAASYDPENGDPIEFYDVRATIIGVTGDASATFETVSTSNPTMDDFRIVVTNIGAVESSVLGQDVLVEGTVSVLWEIYDSGTVNRATGQDINVVLSDLDGLAGQPDTVEGVGIALANLNSYTVEASSNLLVDDNEYDLLVQGTQSGADDPDTKLGAFWAQANQFLITYSSRTQTTQFEMDGDGDVAFVSGVTSATQSLDLDGDDSTAAGQDFAVVYLNGLPFGPVQDNPVVVGDVDLSIYDIDSAELSSVTVTLSNALAGDSLGFDNSVLSALGISGFIDNSVAGEITITLDGPTLVSDFETALKTVTYQNTNPDALFDRSQNRVLDFVLDDGVISSTGAQTIISFGTVSAAPSAVPNVYVVDEDTNLITTATTGLLANDTDVAGDALSIVGAADSSGAPMLFIGTPHTMPSGSILTLNSDGSFTYIPTSQYSGTEYLEYTISDGFLTSTSWVTFDVQARVDLVTLTITQADDTSDEDEITNSVSISVSSPDPSEMQTVDIVGIPDNVIITDGTNSFRADSGANGTTVTDWDLSQIRAIPVQNSDEDIHLTVVATTIEEDGSANYATSSLNFQVNAVADPAVLTISQAGGPIDADTNIGLAIDLRLFDDDGSEEVTDITISNIPAGGGILVGGVSVPISGGSVTIQMADLDDLVFTAPQVGVNSIYNMSVTVTTSEFNAENGVALATSVVGPVTLVVDLNDSDDPIFAEDDFLTAQSGVPIILDVLASDYIPDGGGAVIEINGQTIDTITPITLANGAGVLSLDLSSNLIFTPSDDFSGLTSFTYTARDLDFSTDEALVVVDVSAVWNITGDQDAVEGASANYAIVLNGAIAQGDAAGVDLSLNDVSTTSADHQNFVTAVNDNIAANTDQGFSFDGTTLSYVAPISDYDSSYQVTGNFTDVSAVGTTLNLGDDGIERVDIGFDFNFYGTDFSELFVSANGYVTFGSPVDLPTNTLLDGNAFGGRPSIAVYWDDLAQGSGSVETWTTYLASGLREFTVQWTGVSHETAGGTGTFQIVLHEVDGSVDVNYDVLAFGAGTNNGASATVGVEGADGTFSEYSFNGTSAINSGSSVTIVRTALLAPTLNLTLPIVDDSDFESDETFQISLTQPSGSDLVFDLIDTEIGFNDNTVPIAGNDAFSLGEFGTLSFNVIVDGVGADTDGDGHSLTVTQINGNAVVDGATIVLPSGARLTVADDGSFDYDPNSAFGTLNVGQSTSDVFSYSVEDGFGGVSTANVTMTILGENLIAIVDIQDDGTNAARDTTFVINPSEPPLQITASDAAVFDGDDISFVSVNITLGGFLQASEEVVTIYGEAVLFGVAQNTPISVNGNSLVLDYDGANAITITDASAGEISNADARAVIQSAVYQNISGAELTGIRTVTFQVNDGDNVSNAATAQITVIGVNIPPVAVDDGVVVAFATAEDTSIVIPSTTLLTNDSDGDGHPLTIDSVQGAVNGSVGLDGSGNAVFTPDADYYGPASFTYTITDGNFAYDTASVYLTIAPVVDAPRIDMNGAGAGIDLALTYTENQAPVSIVATDASVLEVDGNQIDAMMITITGVRVNDVIGVGAMPGGIVANVSPTNATSGMTANGTVTIALSNAASPADYQTALRSITFSSTSDTPVTSDRVVTATATAGALTSQVATSVISVVAVNDAPVADDDTGYFGNEDNVLTISAASVLAGDTDIEGDVLTVASVSNAFNGSVSIDGGGNLVFVPTADYSGLASFDYVVTDSNGGNDTGTVSLTVIAVNDLTTIDLDTGSGGDGYTANYVENGAGLAVVDASVSLTDVDDSNIENASVVLTNGFAGDVLEVGGLPSGITAVVSPSGALSGSGTITVTLSGTASLADYETALQAITYRSTADAISTSDRIINVSVNDGTNQSASVLSRITITAVNDLPIAGADGIYNIFEDQTASFAPSLLLANDSDLDGDILTLVSVSGASNGTVSINGLGNIVFDPSSEFSGVAGFSYVISDGNGGTASGSVSLNAVAVNDAPVADLNGAGGGNNTSVNYVENDAPVALIDNSISLSDVDNSNLQSASLVLNNGQAGDLILAPASVGPIGISISPFGSLTGLGSVTVTLTGSGTLAEYEAALQAVTYQSISETPFAGTRSVEVRVNDGALDSVVAYASVNVTSVNDIPVAGNDGPITAIEDTALVIPSTTLLSNDIDLDGDTLVVVSVSNPSNGTVTINGSGNVVFTPTSGASGVASFDYTVSDGNGGSALASVVLSVTPVNDAPILDLNGAGVGADFAISYIENGAALSLVDPTISIFDEDDTVLESAEIVLTNGFAGDVLEAPTSIGPVIINVSPVGALSSSGTITVTLSGTASTAQYEAALQAVTYRSMSETPSTIQRLVTITVNDGELDSAVANTVISVTSVNDVPVANADGSINMVEDTPLSISPALLLGNDSDADSDLLSVSAVSNAVNGTVTINSFGNIIFTPANNYFGPASFDYTVSDGNGGTSLASVSLAIAAVNDAPVADLNGASAGTAYSTSYTENAIGVGIVDPAHVLSDVDDVQLESASVVLNNGQLGDLLEAASSVGPVSISIAPAAALTGNGVVTVTLSGTGTLAQYEAALEAITYRSTSENPSIVARNISIVVNDGSDNSALSTTTIGIVSVNDAPVAADDLSLVTDEDQALIITPLANDTDVEGDSLSVTAIDGVVIAPNGVLAITNGSVELASDGQTLTFTPDVNYFGAVNFAYTVSDGALTDTGNISINVQSVNDAPVALDDGPVVLVEDGSVSFDPVTANDTDVEGDALSVAAINGTPITIGAIVAVDNGTVELAPDSRTLIFVPVADYNGPVVISYSISDGSAFDTANVTFDVTAVNDGTVVNSSPSDMVLNDADIVNLPMGGHFFDVDGDALLFTATGLPAGLSINSTSGVISGVVGSSASQSGPYSVMITATDGLSPLASVTFNIDVLNVAPVGSADATTPANEGSAFAFSATDLISDVDGDVLTFSATGLPAWATIDAASGIVSGVVPFDAALFGPVAVVLSADDGEGGSVSTNLTLDAINPPPEAVSAAGISYLQEGDEFVFDLGSHFVDGGDDGDLLTFTVSGLPDGLSFDAGSGLITGTTATGSAQPLAYGVVLMADDGQGGTVVDILSLRIGDFTTIEDALPEFGSSSERNLTEFLDAPDGATQIVGLDALNEIGSLSGTADLGGDSGILLRSLTSDSSLFQNQSHGAGDGEIGEIGNIGSSDGVFSSSGWISISDSRSANSSPVEFGYSGYEGQDDLVVEPSHGMRFDDLFSIDAYRRQDSVFIELKPQAGLESKVMPKVSIALRDGNSLPDWMRVIRQGFISATPPLDVEFVELAVLVQFEQGDDLMNTVRIDMSDGAVTLLQNSDDAEAELKTHLLDDSELRGTLR